jgi:flagellar protein FlbD
MIIVHRLNGKQFVVNCDLIKYIEATPDTVLTLVSDEKIMVKESVTQIIEAAKLYKQQTITGA